MIPVSVIGDSILNIKEEVEIKEREERNEGVRTRKKI